MDENEGRRNDALLRFYFQIDPDQLSDDEWTERVNELWWCLKTTGKVKIENGKTTFYA